MAAQTLSVNRNLDDAAISGLLNNETITINSGAILTIDSDNKYSQQAAVIGSMVIDSASGGQIQVDGTKVWWIPYDAPVGVVPALGTVGTQNATGATSLATGEFLGIWSALSVAPLAASTSIPSTGFIKFRSKVGTFLDNEVITLSNGATITVNSATGGQRGWIELACGYQRTVTVPRLGKFQTLGDWFDLGVTNGADDQKFTLPLLDHIPAIQIETAVGSGVYEWWLNGASRWGQATVYIPTDARGKYFGQWNPDTYPTLTTTSGSDVITGFTNTSLLRVGQPIHMSAGFAAPTALYIVAINPNVSVTVQINANATVTGTATMRTIEPEITIARRVSNACGFKPVTGLRVRMPNIILTNSGNGAFLGHILTTTIGDRYEFITTSAGEININNVSSNWYFNMSAPYSVSIKNSGIIDTLISNTAADTILDNVAISAENTRDSQMLTFSNLFSGITMNKVRGVRYATAGASSLSTLTDVDGAIITDCMLELFGSTTTITRGNPTVGAITMTRVSNSIITNLVNIGARLVFIQSQNIVCTGMKFADQINGTTVNTNPLTGAIDISSSSINILIDGFSNFASLANVHPYNLIVLVSGGCLDIKLRNIGTSAAPYNCGSANQVGSIFNASVTKGVELKRIYTDNIRVSALVFANTVQDVVVDNVWSDGADAQAIAAVNCLIRGARWSNSITGQVSVYGRHWEDAFISTVAGRLLIAMNEPLAATLNQVTITSGNPKFTSAGTINMPTVGDQVIWEMPYFAIGHTVLANIAPTITGTNTANIALTYQIDLGNGYNGSWLTLNAANLSSHVIPAFVNLYKQGGFKLKVRATTTIASITNALTYIRIDTVTNATEYQRQYPFYVPLVGYTGTLSSSNMAIYVDSTNDLAKTASDSAGDTLGETPWDANYTAIARLRKAGYQPIENTITVDEDGVLIPVEQFDYQTIPESDAGALGITVTNHGASPVTWQSKQFSLTITTTNDSLTASQIANFINYNISQFATFNGFSGLAFPEMVLPDGSNFQTARGRLIGSLGSLLKGVRVVRSDGITPVSGFTQMQADDGTYYVAPVSANFVVNGLTVNSRLFIKNITTNTVIYNSIHGSASYTNAYDNGTIFTAGDAYEARVTYVNGATAKRPFKLTGTVASTGITLTVAQENWTEYTSAGVDGSLVTECSTDYSNIQVDIDDPDNITLKSRISAFIVFAMHNQAQGIVDWFDVINYKSAGSAVIKSSVALVKIDNIKTGIALNVIDPFQLRMDNGSSMVDTSSNTINWDNSSEVVVVETGTSGLTSTEAATLELLNDLTEDVSGIRFTTKALEQAPSGGGGGGSLTAADVWSHATRTLTTAFPTIPTASQNASATRTELATELARIDVATSSRLSSAGYTAPPSASSIRAEIDANSIKLDVAVSTRNSTTPDNSSIAAIKAKTDNLPSDPADNSQVLAAIHGISLGTVPTVQDIRAEMDANSIKLASILADTNELQTNQGNWETATGFSTASDITTAKNEIITEVNANESKIDIIDSNVDAIKVKTDSLVNTNTSDLAKSSEIDETKAIVFGLY